MTNSHFPKGLVYFLYFCNLKKGKAKNAYPNTNQNTLVYE